MNEKLYRIASIDFTNTSIMMQSLALFHEVFKSDIFTPQWWKWKYLESPFGKAQGWCIIEKSTNKVVSIRIIWKWQLIKGSQLKDAYQMVDSVTAPDYRGCGFFKILTQQALSFIGTNTIFNFPNSNSAPLNAKLGWRELCNQPWLLCVSFFSRHLNYRFGELKDVWFDNKLYTSSRGLECWQTHWTRKSLQWRFVEHPKFKYYYFNVDDSIIIYKIDKIKFIKIATIVYINNSTIKLYNSFSSFLFTKGIVAFRYNAYNNDDYYTLKRLKRCFSIKKNFRYFVRNEESNIMLTTGDTDFL